MINMESWLSDSLSSLLDFSVPDDMIKYVLSIENGKDLEEYMRTLLNFDDPKHKGFFTEFVNKRFNRGRPQGQNSQKKKISKNKENKPVDFITKADIPPAEKAESDQNETNKSKKKAKFVNLYSQDGQKAQVVLLKGRHHCDCQASKHPLINNCVNCGRIVCKQEGSGPCLFCGNLVCTPEEQKEVNSKSKAGAKLIETLMEKKRPKGWEAALAQRDRLLEYDRTSERRTRVTDDDSDYFSSNSVWLSAAEREKLQQYQRSVQDKRHASRLNKKITFDFGGRRIVEDEDVGYEIDENKINAITSGQGGVVLNGEQSDSLPGVVTDRDVAPGVNAPLLAFDPSVPSLAPARCHLAASPYTRVQDGGIQEMVDAGRCLSMHQPWASLLVEGIKMHEGRTWYSSHRGRLWIASTVKPPDPDTVRSLEDMYRALHPDKALVFPSFYPTGCLLGCVNVDDCLPQEEYQKIYPGGESDSPYVFICSNPMSLRLRFPVKGQHKIYNLDRTIHQAAVKFMLKSAKQSAEA